MQIPVIQSKLEDPTLQDIKMDKLMKDLQDTPNFIDNRTP